jgi:hypothetical protein
MPSRFPDVVLDTRKDHPVDGDRFDALARSLAVPRPRRAFLKGVAGGAVGGLLVLIGRDEASADDCKRTGKQCKKGIQCCSGNCVPSPSGSKSTAGSDSICCPAGQVQYPTGACCAPDNAAACAGKNCGTVTNNCGQPVDCGTCTSPQTCGGGGTANVCGCTPTTCAAQHATCGSIPDGCGGTLDCNSCDADACLFCDADHACASTCTGDQVCCGGRLCGLAVGARGCVADGDCCSGTCVAGVCQATPGGDGAPCDSAADCAGGIPCVDGVCCASTIVCGGTCCASDAQVCFDNSCCAPKTCAEQGANCGELSDTCGGALDCGTCNAPQTCGGGGIPNACGCTPTTCQAGQCGQIVDGCGGNLDCGGCGGGEQCLDGICQAVCQPILAACDPNEPGGACCDDAVCDFTRHCCFPTGAPCTLLVGGGYGCCEGNNCVAQGNLGARFCVSCAGDFNHAFGGDACTANSQCCSDFCHTPTGNCCEPLGAPCSGLGPFSFECCPYLGLTCNSDTEGTCIQCVAPGGSCVGSDVASTCCLGASCQSGVCILNQCGGVCQDDSTCCDGQVCDRVAGHCVF